MSRAWSGEEQPGVASPGRAVRILASVLVAALACALWVMRAPLFDGNFHSVIPGAVYRSAQLSREDLDSRIAEFGIRSIINLRMIEPLTEDGFGAAEEARLAQERSVAYYGVRMSAPRLAPRATLQELIEILDSAERPILIHCRNGAERSGWASAVATLLEGIPIEHARAQFALRYGYLAWLFQSDLPSWIDLYEDWLRAGKREHTGARVREFARSGYTPYFYNARIEPISFPERVVAERRQRLVFRVTNESPQPWTFTPSSSAGVHLGLRVESLDPTGAYKRELRGDTSTRVFAPGESIELSATLPGLPAQGRYRVTVDLVDEAVVWFAQMGSTALGRIVEVEELPPL